MIKLVIYIECICAIVLFSSCISSKKGGAIPVFIDEYSGSTYQRRFELNEEFVGKIIEYQKSYECKNDSIIFFSTAIVKALDDLITVYTPCLDYNFNSGDLIRISPIYLEVSRTQIREIYKQFPKNSMNYPYWECISCKYKNTFGSIEKVD